MPKDPTSHWLSKVFRKLKRFGSNLEATEVLKVTGYHKKKKNHYTQPRFVTLAIRCHEYGRSTISLEGVFGCICLHKAPQGATKRHKAPQSATKRHEHTTYHTIILLNFLEVINMYTWWILVV
jgi:hypothetical protein